MEIIKKVWKGIWKDSPHVTAYGGGMPSIGCFGITALVTFGIAGLFVYALKSGFDKHVREENPNLQKSNSFITAKVLDEFYEKVDNRSNYTLRCLTDKNKEMYISITDALTKKKESLDSLINKGDKITFPKGNLSENIGFISGYHEIEEEIYFTDSTKVGNKCADRIKVLK